MLEQFTVENFKGFEKLTLEDLGHINIFVGKNNTGKTSLLQAVALYNLANWALARQGYSKLLTHVKNKTIPLSDVEVTDFGSLPLPFSQDADSKFFFRDSNTDNAITLRGHSGEDSFSSFFHILSSYFEVLDVISETNEKRTMILRFSKHPKDEELSYMHPSNVFLASNVSYEGLATKYYYDAEQKKLDCSIVKILKDNISPCLQSIKYDNKAHLAVDLSDKPVLLPLASMGDGFIKLLGLTTVLLGHEAKKICIDEPENGFHYSVQSQFWQLLATAGLEHGKQSFIATHSYELLESLNTLLNENPDLTKPKEDGGQGLKVRVYKLERVEEKLQVVKITASVLDALINHGSEMRG